MTTKEMVLAKKMMDEQTMKAIVGRMSNLAGHNEMKKSAPRRVILYTEMVSAVVARIVIPASRASSVRAKRTDWTTRTVLCCFSLPASLGSKS